MVVESDSPAPDFALADLSGNTVSLTDFRGQVVVLNFWATWCGPCVEEMPMFQKYQDQYPDMVMIGVDAEEKPQTVIDFLSDKGLSYLMLLDEKAIAGDLYQVLVLPTTYFIDEEGTIRFRHIGVISEAQLEAYLGSLGVVE
jgi:thiol-disulfide isomerase/thioredoxin